MYQLYLVKYAGVDPTTGQSLFWAKDDEGNAYTTADYAVASNCKEATGDLLPTVYGGFGTCTPHASSASGSASLLRVHGHPDKLHCQTYPDVVA